MRKSFAPLLLSLLCAALVVRSAPARAEPASGFMLQGLLGGGTTLVGIAPVNSSLHDNPFTVMPVLRIGAMLRPLVIAANVSYFSGGSLPSNGSYTGTNVIVIGPDFMPFVWRSAGAQARLYLLFGFNVGADISTSGSNNHGDVTGGFTVGAGGHYFLHPNFGLGIEVGSRTQFTGASGGLLATSTLYAALSGTFVAGH